MHVVAFHDSWLMTLTTWKGRQKDASWDGRVSLEDADIYVKGRLAEYPNPEDVLGSASEASYVFAAGWFIIQGSDWFWFWYLLLYYFFPLSNYQIS